MSQASSYLDVLTTEIGPRPSASDTERQAAEWLQDKFTDAGIPAELHDFDAPRSPQTARIITYVLAPLALAGIGASFLEQMWVIHWACWLVLLGLSILTILDLFGPKGPLGLVALLPKAPSQNVVAKSVPSSYSPGDMPKKVVLVANYDTAQTSPLSSEATAGLVRPLQAIANTLVIVMPLLALLLIVKPTFLLPAGQWVFYGLLILCIPSMLLFLDWLIARIMNRYSPGANNNASGVAALLVAMDKLQEGQHGHSGHTQVTAAVKLAAAEAKASAAARQSSKMPGVGYETMPGSVKDLPRGEVIAESTGVSGHSASFERLGSLDLAVPPRPEEVQSAASEDLQTTLAGLSAELETPVAAPAAAPAASAAQVTAASPNLHLETVEFAKLGDESKVEISSIYAAMDDYDAQTTFSDEGDGSGSMTAASAEMLDASVFGEPVDDGSSARTVARETQPTQSRAARKESTGRSSAKKAGKKGFFSFGKKKAEASHEDDPANWLGLEDDFNARKEGRAIGSWDNFDDASAGAGDDGVIDLTDSFAPMGGMGDAPDGVVDLTDSFAPLGGPDDDDGFSWKGGFAGDDPIEDAGYASAEAARIRRKVVDSLDVEMKEKEVWFVATGSHYAERAGIRAFLNNYGDQVRNAVFINVSAVGSGDLYWATKERFGRSYTSSARLTSMLRRLSRESDIRIKAWKKGSIVSDAGPLLASNCKAVTITRLNDKGAPFALASVQDTAARLDSNGIDEAADIVCSIIRES